MLLFSAKVHGWMPQSKMWAFAAGDVVISLDLRPTESAYSLEKTSQNYFDKTVRHKQIEAKFDMLSEHRQRRIGMTLDTIRLNHAGRFSVINQVYTLFADEC